MAKPLVERFWEKVQKTDGCWPWAGVTARSTGYGYIWAHGRMNYAHRTAWLLTHGPILEGLWVLHHCDVPACCNPAHLFLGTQSVALTGTQVFILQNRGVETIVTSGSAGGTRTFDVQQDINIIKFGLNYRFGNYYAAPRS